MPKTSIFFSSFSQYKILWIINWDVITLKPPLKLYSQLVTVKLLIYLIVFRCTSFMLKSSAKCLVDCSGYREKHLEGDLKKKINPSFSKEKQLHVLSIILLLSVLLLFLFITIFFMYQDCLLFLKCKQSICILQQYEWLLAF